MTSHPSGVNHPCFLPRRAPVPVSAPPRRPLSSVDVDPNRSDAPALPRRQLQQPSRSRFQPRISGHTSIPGPTTVRNLPNPPTSSVTLARPKPLPLPLAKGKPAATSVTAKTGSSSVYSTRSALPITSHRMPAPKPAPSALTMGIEVHMDHTVVDMVGGTQTGSHYSLPGFAILTFTPIQCGRVREVKEVKLQVEGRAEYYDHQGRYNPKRIFHNTVELVTPSNPILVPECQSAKPLLPPKIAIPFDLRLPGWLPPTHSTNLTEVSYGLVVTARLDWDKEVVPATSSGSIAKASKIPVPSGSSPGRQLRASDENSLMVDGGTPIRKGFRKRPPRPRSQLTPPTRAVDPATERTFTSPFTPFIINRHRLPSAVCTTANARTERTHHFAPPSGNDSPVEALLTIPEWQDINAGRNGLSVSIRFRCRRGAIEQSLKERGLRLVVPNSGTDGSRVLEHEVPTGTCVDGVDGCKPWSDEVSPKSPITSILTYIQELSAVVEEVETFSSDLWLSFASQFPLPGNQPVQDRNTTTNPLLGRATEHPRPIADHLFSAPTTRFTGHRSRLCLLADDGNPRNFEFDGDGLGISEMWRKVNVIVPMPLGGLQPPAADMDGPFLKIKHNLTIKVVCKNIGTPSVPSVVQFSCPVKFGTSPQTSLRHQDPRRLNSHPIAPLPAYVQLFHENGDPHDSDPLPVYKQAMTPEHRALTSGIMGTQQSQPTSHPFGPAPDYAPLQHVMASSASISDCLFPLSEPSSSVLSSEAEQESPEASDTTSIDLDTRVGLGGSSTSAGTLIAVTPTLSVAHHSLLETPRASATFNIASSPRTLGAMLSAR